MRKRLFLCVIAGIILPTTGCASTKGGFLSGLFTAKVADEVKVADKVIGVESAKVADSAQAGVGNQANKTNIKQTVGGSINNDAELMKQYIQALKDSNDELVKSKNQSDRRFMTLLKIFFGSLFTLIFRYELQIRKLTNRLLDMISQDKEKDENRLDKALDENKKG